MTVRPCRIDPTEQVIDAVRRKLEADTIHVYGTITDVERHNIHTTARAAIQVLSSNAIPLTRRLAAVGITGEGTT